MLAIDVEQVNGTRLRNFADLFADLSPEAAWVFAEMAAEEDQHRSQLESLHVQRYGTIQRTLAQDEVPEVVEAHDLDDAEHQIFDSLSLRVGQRTESSLELGRKARPQRLNGVAGRLRDAVGFQRNFTAQPPRILSGLVDDRIARNGV